ncbi:MAG: HAD family hydrolase [Gemmatimonadetes bacterium]|nr:HAD family hydrolase [Gemmatimonadota bacterium]
MTEPTGTDSGETTAVRRARVSIISGERYSAVIRETRAAIFFDRDGTIIRDTGYVRRPDDVELMPTAGAALRCAHNALRPVIVITNQSGIARGLMTEADFAAVQQRTSQLLSEHGAFFDGAYMCPHHPEFTGPCECRKPALALYERAIQDHGVDPSQSAFIGDRWHDVAPALHYGGTGVLVPSPTTPADELEQAKLAVHIAPNLLAAVELALNARS